MKVMLICIGGVSTNVLAFKLQKYAEEHDYHDHIMAKRVLDYQEFLEEIDLILLAPQAKAYEADIISNASKQSIQTIKLDELAFSRSDIESIYSLILQNRRSETMKPPRMKILPCKEILGVLTDCIVSCLLFFLSALLFQWCYTMTKWPIWLWLWQVTGGIFGIYLMFSTGYHYGKRIKREPLQCAFVSLVSTILLLPVSNTASDNILTFFRVTNAFIPLSSFAFDKCLYLFALSLLSAILYSALNDSSHTQDSEHDRANLMRLTAKRSIYTSITLLIFFILRLCIEFIC